MTQKSLCKILLSDNLYKFELHFFVCRFDELSPHSQLKQPTALMIKKLNLDFADMGKKVFLEKDRKKLSQVHYSNFLAYFHSF